MERILFETLSTFLNQFFSEPLPGHASITAVEVKGDLRNARVYFRISGEKPIAEKTQEILSAHRADFQRYVATQIEAKFCPVLRFEFGVVDKLDEVDLLFKNLHQPKWQNE